MFIQLQLTSTGAYHLAKLLFMRECIVLHLYSFTLLYFDRVSVLIRDWIAASVTAIFSEDTQMFVCIIASLLTYHENNCCL